MRLAAAARSRAMRRSTPEGGEPEFGEEAAPDLVLDRGLADLAITLGAQSSAFPFVVPTCVPVGGH